MLHRVLGVLRGIFEPKGINVPNPIQTVCTRWGSDPLSYGSYSHVRVGSSGKDYDILAENVMGRLFFAGEATSRQYPATMHGAFLSGLREASAILRTSKNRESLESAEMKKSLLKNSKICLDILQNMFKRPDMSCGNFEFVFNPLSVDDPEALCLMRFRLTSNNDEACHFGLRRDSIHKQTSALGIENLHLYAILSREQASKMQDLSKDEGKALHMLSRSFNLELMGSRSLCSVGSSLITSIANSRKARRRKHSNGILQ